MKSIAIAAVTAGGKTTLVNALQRRLPNAAALCFDSYTFPREVEDFHQWVLDGADYRAWDLAPLIEDIRAVQAAGTWDYLLLDYPFAYCHEAVRGYINCAVFIDTPLDIALARRVLRDQRNASGAEIRKGLELYLKYARIAYSQMLKNVLPSSDLVIDGTKDLDAQISDVLAFLEPLPTARPG